MDLKNSDIKAGHFIGAYAAAWMAVMLMMPYDMRGSDGEAAYAAGFVFSMSALALIPLAVAFIAKRDYSKAIFLISMLAFTVIGLAGNSGLGRSKMTAEQCVINEMRGQPANMTSLVVQECRRKYPPANK